MNNEYNPPINKRSTEDLLSIVENVEDWKEDALIQARKELQTRGYTVAQQKRREESENNYQRRVAKIKANATYPRAGLVGLFVFAPILFVLPLSKLPITIDKSFIRLKDEGFEKKWKQRLLMTTLGNLSWFIILYFTV